MKGFKSKANTYLKGKMYDIILIFRSVNNIDICFHDRGDFNSGKVEKIIMIVNDKSYG